MRTLRLQASGPIPKITMQNPQAQVCRYSTQHMPLTAQGPTIVYGISRSELRPLEHTHRNHNVRSQTIRFVLVSLFFLFLLACSHAPTPSFPGSAASTQAQDDQLREAAALQDHARSLFDQGRYADALPPAKNAVEIRERVQGPTHQDLATALTTLGLIHGTLIELSLAKPLLERALEIRRSAFGERDVRVGESLTNLATVLYASGDFISAIQALEQSLLIRELALGPSHPDVAVTLTHLAIAERGLSRLEKARLKAERAISILQAKHLPQSKDLAMALNVAGNIVARQGHFEQARSLLGESLQLFEQALGPQHPDVAGALIQMAMLENKQGNFAAALPLLNQALMINEHSYGKDNPEVAGNLYEIGLAERALGRMETAQQRFERSLRIQEATVGPGHPFVGLTLVELAEGSRLQGDVAAARTFLQRALQVQEGSLGPDHTSVATTLTKLGYLEVYAGNLSTAEGRFERAVKIRERALGLTHPDVASGLFDLARAKHARGALSDARPLYERARRIIQGQAGKNSGLDDEALARLWKREVKGLQDYALLLAMLARTSANTLENHSAMADGFTVSQQARGWLMQAAVARILAQRAVGDSSTAALAKGVADLRRKRQALWTQLNELYGLADAQRLTEELSAVKGALSTVQQELDQAGAALRNAAPRYAEMAQPETLNVDAAQRFVRSDEALVSFYTLGDRIQIWLIRPGQQVVYRQSDISRDQLIQLVRQIRLSLLPKEGSDSRAMLLSPFDVESASQLYQLLFVPIAPQLDGVNKLIVVPDEVLLPLPFALLITEPQGDAFSRLRHRYREQHPSTSQDLASYTMIPWMVKQYSLTVLPSISALKLIRQQPGHTDLQGEPFLGFGDPALRGQGHQRGGTMTASRGMQTSMESLHSLDRLPGTREELLTVAALLGVKAETNLFLGPRATESEVRRLNVSGRLGQAKVLAFATHGLLAGEVQGVTQPALVLTPPPIPTEEDDGLLSMEDVLQLKLPQTEWVILSACNTAGDNGSGESLTGLARAFFFAGARSLLVSQWSVDDRATKVLMEEVFQRYGAGRFLPPAEALRAGMLALLDHASNEPDRRYFAHPYAWAPFMVVGDGQFSRR